MQSSHPYRRDKGGPFKVLKEVLQLLWVLRVFSFTGEGGSMCLLIPFQRSKWWVSDGSIAGQRLHNDKP